MNKTARLLIFSDNFSLSAYQLGHDEQRKNVKWIIKILPNWSQLPLARYRVPTLQMKYFVGTSYRALGAVQIIRRRMSVCGSSQTKKENENRNQDDVSMISHHHVVYAKVCCVEISWNSISFSFHIVLYVFFCFMQKMYIKSKKYMSAHSRSVRIDLPIIFFFTAQQPQPAQKLVFNRYFSYLLFPFSWIELSISFLTLKEINIKMLSLIENKTDKAQKVDNIDFTMFKKHFFLDFKNENFVFHVIWKLATTQRWNEKLKIIQLFVSN